MPDYPDAVANLTNPVGGEGGDKLNSPTVPHAAQHAAANDELEAVETDLGLRAGRRLRGGNRVLAVGDSLSSWEFILAPLGPPWPNLAAMKSQGRLRLVHNGAVGGDSSADVLGDLPDLLTEHEPTLVYVWVGANDAFGAVSADDFMDNLTEIHRLISEAGARSLFLTIAPREDTDPEIFCGYNHRMRIWASDEGVPLVDVYPLLADTGGNLAAAYDNGDGVHLNAAARSAVADLVLPAALHEAKAWSPSVAVDEADPHNLVANPLFLDNDDGEPTVPDSWSGSSLVAGVTRSVTTDPDFVGNVWKLDIASPVSGTGSGLLYIASSGFAPGDRVLMTARLKVLSSADMAEGKGAFLRCSFVGGSGGDFYATKWYRTPDGIVTLAAEAVVTSGTTDLWIAPGVDYTSGDDAISVMFGQIGLWNLTDLGV